MDKPPDTLNLSNGPKNAVLSGTRAAWTPILVILLLLVPYINQFGLKLVGAESLDLESFYYGAQVTFVHQASTYGVDGLAIPEKALGRPIYPFIYPPPSLLFFWPLAYVTFDVAKVILIALNFFCLLGSLILLLLTLDFPSRPGVRTVTMTFLIVYALMFPAISISIRVGQVNLVLMFLLCLTMVGMKRGWPDWITAIPLAIAIVLKVYPVLIVLALLLRKRLKLAILTIGLVAIAYGLSVFLLPSVTWSDYISKVATKSGYGVDIVKMNPGEINAVGINSVTMRIFHGTQFAKPIVPNEDLAKWVPTGLCIGVVLLTGLASWRMGRRAVSSLPEIEIGLYLSAMVLIAPLAWEPHLGYAMPAIFVALIHCVFSGRSITWRLLVAMAALLIAWPQFTSGIPDRYLLRHLVPGHKTFGIAIIWLALLVVAFRSSSGKPQRAELSPA